MMMIEPIADGESGESVRAKLNAAIEKANNAMPADEGGDESGWLPESVRQMIVQGFIDREQTIGDIDADLAVAVALNLIGAPVVGGFYAGIIDTTRGNIDDHDYYDARYGRRYALILAPRSLQGGAGASPAPGLPSGALAWDRNRRGWAHVAQSRTRWNGLLATDYILDNFGDHYEVHRFVQAVRDLYPAPQTPNGSQWYVPALDELELIFRHFKPAALRTNTGTTTARFPSAVTRGLNPSSDPASDKEYSNEPLRPGMTRLSAFQQGGSEALDLERYWTTTDADDALGRAWFTIVNKDRYAGVSYTRGKDETGYAVRPVRRVYLDWW